VIEVMDLTGYLDQRPAASPMACSAGWRRRFGLDRPAASLLMDEPGRRLSAAETLRLFEHLARSVPRAQNRGRRGRSMMSTRYSPRCGRVTVLDLVAISHRHAPGNSRDHRGRRRLSRNRRDECSAHREVVSGYGASTVLHAPISRSMRVNRWRWSAATGPGKSTLLLSVFRETTIISGAIWVHVAGSMHARLHGGQARAFRSPPRGRRILPHLTVKEHLLLSKATGGQGIWNLRAVYVCFPCSEEARQSSRHHLSGGQQQMLAIGRTDGQSQPGLSRRAVGRPFTELIPGVRAHTIVMSASTGVSW